jgi:hypothetical protein
VNVIFPALTPADNPQAEMMNSMSWALAASTYTALERLTRMGAVESTAVALFSPPS